MTHIGGQLCSRVGQAGMIAIGEAMSPHGRAKVGSEQARVLAPLAVLVSCALLVLAQLYLAITLAPVIAEALGAGGPGAAAALGTT